MAEEHKAGSYYKAMEGMKFTGTHIGTYNRVDGTSIEWQKLEIYEKLMPKETKEALAKIKDKFEGKIWKGVHEGVVYVNLEDHGEDFGKTIKKAHNYEFEIKGYKYLRFSNPKEPKKYTDKCGFCFTLK